jgi:hypothetical protein
VLGLLAGVDREFADVHPRTGLADAVPNDGPS